MSIPFVNPRRLKDRYLDTNGDGSGTKIAVGDYSDVGLGATDFYIQPPVGEAYRLERVIVHIGDATAPDAGGYGGNNSPLTNGISVTVQDSTSQQLNDLTDALPVTTNGEWARLCFDVDPSEFGQGVNYVDVRWTFSKAGVPLDLYDRNKLVFTLNDDFSFLTDHTFMVQGWQKDL